MRKKAKKIVIFKAPVKKKTQPVYRFHSFWIPFLATFLLIFSFLSWNGWFFVKPTSPQTSLSSSNDRVIFSADLLTASPSAEPTMTLPLVLDEAIPGTPEASLPQATVSAEAEQDFCQHVPVLLYHHIQPLSIAEQLGHQPLTIDSGIFEEQMQYLVNNGYTAISAEDLARALIARRELPPKSVVITIDDGYDDAYLFGFMMAKKYHLVMSFMIPSSLIGTPGFMTWDHLKEMNTNPYARIYNHTATHAAIGLLERPQIEEELSTSSAAFVSNLGLPNSIFTYPYGSFSDLAIQIVKEQGFIGAYSTIEGQEQCSSQIMTLPRSHIGNAPLSEYGL